MWQMLADMSAAEAFLAEAEARCQGAGVEKVAASISISLAEATADAFESQRDPRTHRAWAPPADATLHDRGFKHLLNRSGELRRAVQAGYQLVPAGARVEVEITGATDVLRRGLVHMYGVKARTRRSNRRSRLRPTAAMPARRFVGMWREDVAAAVELAERELMPERT